MNVFKVRFYVAPIKMEYAVVAETAGEAEKYAVEFLEQEYPKTKPATAYLSSIEKEKITVIDTLIAKSKDESFNYTKSVPDGMDEQKEFEKWWNENEKGMFHAQLDEKQVAYSAWLGGISATQRYYRKNS